MPTYLYYLADPRTPRWPRYVGITESPSLRLDGHRQRSTGPSGKWKAGLRLAGVAPTMVILATFDTREGARDAEWRLIHRWRRRGLCDANSARDGRGECFAAYCAARNARTKPKPAPRVELGTARLRIGCSTTELSRQRNDNTRPRPEKTSLVADDIPTTYHKTYVAS